MFVTCLLVSLSPEGHTSSPHLPFDFFGVIPKKIER